MGAGLLTGRAVGRWSIVLSGEALGLYGYDQYYVLEVGWAGWALWSMGKRLSYLRAAVRCLLVFCSPCGTTPVAQVSG